GSGWVARPGTGKDPTNHTRLETGGTLSCGSTVGRGARRRPSLIRSAESFPFHSGSSIPSESSGMNAARFSTNEAITMSALGRNTRGPSPTLPRGPEPAARTAPARRSRPSVERLEKLLLLSAGLPVMSGSAILDQNDNTVLTNDGDLGVDG